MSEFIDLAGSSGALYRFQRVPDLDALPFIAGNFVYVRGHGESLSVICAGTGESLRVADRRWNEAVREHKAEALFVRKNVSRRSREQEHRDIVGVSAPSIDAAEDFEGRG
jgi:uncharacterized membrane protein